MIRFYIDKLIEALRSDKRVKVHSLLKGHKWTQSSYELLSDMIGDQLTESLTPEERLKWGISVSSKTLKNLFSGKYVVSEPMDPRAYITLTKCTRFLGFKDWDGFTTSAGADPVKSLSENYRKMIHSSLSSKLATYRALPKIESEELTLFYPENSPAFNEIMTTCIENQELGRVLHNPYNPSTYELLEFELREEKEDMAVIRTKEYWLLCWWSVAEKKYKKRERKMSEQLYILEPLVDKEWRIRTQIPYEQKD